MSGGQMIVLMMVASWLISLPIGAAMDKLEEKIKKRRAKRNDKI